MEINQYKRVAIVPYKVNQLVLALLLLMMLNIASCTALQPSTPFTNPQGTPYPPVPTIDKAQVKLGRQVYQATCAMCHGRNAEGAPNWMTPDAQGNQLAPHDDSGHTWHHSDRVLHEMIRDGMRDPLHPNSAFRMPAFGNKLSDVEIRAVIAYFKSLWSPDHREYQWEQTVDDFLPTPTPSP